MSERSKYAEAISDADAARIFAERRDQTPKPMRSTITLTVEITHSVNLRTDAQGFVDEIAALVTNEVGQYDRLASATGRLRSAVIVTQS